MSRKKVKILKNVIVCCLVAAFSMAVFAGCGSTGSGKTSGGTASDTEKTDDQSTGKSSASGPISVVSREEGSGTRGAFVELTGVEDKESDGTKKDLTTDSAVIANSTDVVMNNVKGDPSAIGYISLGSLNDSVKAIKIDGVDATVDNVKSGTYKLARPFMIAVSRDKKLSDAATDFYNYIMSADGQQIIEDNKYIKIDESAANFKSAKPSGKVVVAGSSSVTPVMEKLAEAYQKVNPDTTVEVNQSDSTTGMTSAIDGTCDIGMASRDLSDDEASKLTGTQIALDGIAVIVNNDNSTDNLSMDQVKSIYTGETSNWEELK